MPYRLHPRVDVLQKQAKEEEILLEGVLESLKLDNQTSPDILEVFRRYLKESINYLDEFSNAPIEKFFHGMYVNNKPRRELAYEAGGGVRINKKEGSKFARKLTETHGSYILKDHLKIFLEAVVNQK